MVFSYLALFIPGPLCKWVTDDKGKMNHHANPDSPRNSPKEAGWYPPPNARYLARKRENKAKMEEAEIYSD